ncbi:hypothetical protein X801_07829 [Opisthorchis viverrini]|uniref:B30.2/SPRY domain-containing protein n=1 Tax=Opisthorchis viverrini TaxID=6198 RepID=A0A1S8WPF8_OPIVI|nr:hypothetical protein X801_07829 [Opisthorchis viverrini]
MLAYRKRSEHSSFGYHNDGSVYHGSASAGIKFGPRFGENDTVGCGVDFMSRSLFFTRNGVFLGKAFEGKVPDPDISEAVVVAPGSIPTA